MSKISLEGLCLSGTRCRVEIVKTDHFAIFLHVDSQEPIRVLHEIENIRTKDHLVSIGMQHRLHVVEHLFSALYGLHLFNVRVDVFGDEVPFFDGSSLKFVDSLAALEAQSSIPAIILRQTITVKGNNGAISFWPIAGDELIVDMELKHAYIGTQRIVLSLNPGIYKREIAPARTFVFTEEDDPRLRNLPPYGIGITGRKLYSATPLRFTNEPVRHKLLDLLGDLYVLRRPLVGKIVAQNTSHQLNLSFVKAVHSLLDYQSDFKD